MDSAPYPAAAADPEATPRAAPPPRPLTPRQERFCHAYVSCPNAARAARVAGYSRRTAKSQGWRLLRSRRVRARLAEIQAELARDCGGERDALIGKLEVVYRQAVADHSAYAAARAVELQARLTGLPVRRLAAQTPAAEARPRYSEQELDAMIARAEAEVARIMDEKRRADDAWLADRSASVGKGQRAVDTRSTESPHGGRQRGGHAVDTGATPPPAARTLDFAAGSGPLAKR